MRLSQTLVLFIFVGACGDDDNFINAGMNIILCKNNEHN